MQSEVQPESFWVSHAAATSQCHLEGLQALGGAGPGRPGHCSQTGGPHGGKQQTNKQTVLLLPELYKGEDLTSLGNDQL